MAMCHRAEAFCFVGERGHKVLKKYVRGHLYSVRENAMKIPEYLLARAQDGDEIALEKILSIAEPFVREFVTTHIEDHNDADDVIQMTLIWIWDSLQKKRDQPIRDFDAWCSRIIWRAINNYRRHGWDGRASTDREIPFSSHFGPETDEEVIEGEVVRRGIW